MSVLRDPALRRLLLLTRCCFFPTSAWPMSLPIVPVYVSGTLRLGNALAGLSVGIAFLTTILTRGYAGSLTDRRGAKLAVGRGLAYYAAGALVSVIAGLQSHDPRVAYLIVIAGRLLLGLGESLVAVGVIGWGIGLVGPARSGMVLSLVGAALYGALAVGGPHRPCCCSTSWASPVRWRSARCCPASVCWPSCPSPAWRRSPMPCVRRSGAWSAGSGRMARSCACRASGFAMIGAFFVLYFLDRHWAHAGLGLTAFGGGFVLVRVFFGQFAGSHRRLPGGDRLAGDGNHRPGAGVQRERSGACLAGRVPDGPRLFDDFSGDGTRSGAHRRTASACHGFGCIRRIPGTLHTD
ncbi:MAG: hypothetical protein WDO12_02555 [Pseudomonadota bacterium]